MHKMFLAATRTRWISIIDLDSSVICMVDCGVHSKVTYYWYLVFWLHITTNEMSALTVPPDETTKRLAIRRLNTMAR